MAVAGMQLVKRPVTFNQFEFVKDLRTAVRTNCLA